jgi:hypothetical protein
MREENPGVLLRRRDLYNRKAAARRYNLGGRSLIEALLEKLERSDQWLTEARVNGITHRLESLFFTTVKQTEFYHACPNILLIDNTYKTNRYKMPLMHIAARTPTGQFFSIGYCFLSGEAEKDFK